MFRASLVVSLASACTDPSLPSGGTDTGDLPFVPYIETLAVSAGSDDVTWHPDGFLLVSDLVGDGGWPVTPLGDTILAVDPGDGTVTTWGTGVPRPIGATLGIDGTMFVAAYGASSGVWMIAPEGGAASIVQDGLSYPSSVTFADDGSLLVTEWGADQVSSLFDGAALPVATLPGPVGLDRNADGEVIVGGSDGWIYTLGADGAATPWVELPEGRPADFAVAGGATYVTSLESHRVWEIGADAVVRSLVGQDLPGNEDGPLDEASLDRPNGIAASADGDRLFVQQLDKRLRVIHLR